MIKHRYSLNIHITTLFLILAIMLGGGLITISYLHSQQLLSQISKALSKENATKLENTFQRKISPILTTLDLMATRALPPAPESEEDRRRWLKSIQMIFSRNPDLVALFYGDNAGNSTQFRPLNDQFTKELFSVQETDASIMLNYTAISGKNDFLFFDDELKHVTTQSGDNNQYDPRKRPWYINARPDGEIALTEPYDFYFLKTMGVTLSRVSMDNDTVVAADITLDQLSRQLSDIAISGDTKLALFDTKFNLIAGYQYVPESDNPSIPSTSELFEPVLNRTSSNIIYEKVFYEDEYWSVTLTPVTLTNHINLILAEATPESELLFDLYSMRDKQIFAALLMLIASFVVIWVTVTRLTKPLKILSVMTENIRSFRFKKTRYPKSIIREVNELTYSIELMEHTLYDLLTLLQDTASKHDFEQLAKTITKQTYLITKAETIVLAIDKEQDNQFTVEVNHSIIPFKIGINEILENTPWLKSELLKGEIVKISKHDNLIKNYQNIFYNSEAYLFPMLNRRKKLVGVLIVGYERTCNNIQKDKHAFLRELLNFAQISKENIDQIERQKKMVSSFIELMATAIDTKSPYTGSHCHRVPQIAQLLTEAAVKDKSDFADFSMTPENWEELNLAAWLHDCGKVTTPEYIVDKATKLETIYDRIHEVRMRFELLKANAETEFWKSINRGEDKQKAQLLLEEAHQQLDEEFEFIASCNLGNKTITSELNSKIEQIASRTWTRTLDDQLGVSWVELERAGEKMPLPTEEKLLSDKDSHLVPWDETLDPRKNWDEEYNLKPSHVQYNRGELYNLSVKNGTLTAEERFMINDHIIQTIKLLRQLPYQEHMKNVPDIAGNHHERIDGQGYPRGLTIDQLTVQERVMAIADIFEAITSSDRPYKKAHTLEEAIEIMSHLATSGHIDPKLYLLFLTNKIDQTYAGEHLKSSQIVEFDRNAHIKAIKSYIAENS
ncbi:HD domain-containing phosphohydrolase [Vibrio hannami]|uniref:HD domain-containing phosphohydrolase n=1 Tax=Vibrio hannami TaxID=2717094 RepID=UPI002410AB74|nr:HD domain-containing phosphohydrolase [Vibrio hannami]MDG3085396.1 HD domain-containing phosphohydrolase [Vibrio hannami]